MDIVGCWRRFYLRTSLGNFTGDCGSGDTRHAAFLRIESSGKCEEGLVGWFADSFCVGMRTRRAVLRDTKVVDTWS